MQNHFENEGQLPDLACFPSRRGSSACTRPSAALSSSGRSRGPAPMGTPSRYTVVRFYAGRRVTVDGRTRTEFPNQIYTYGYIHCSPISHVKATTTTSTKDIFVQRLVNRIPSFSLNVCESCPVCLNSRSKP